VAPHAFATPPGGLRRSAKNRPGGLCRSAISGRNNPLSFTAGCHGARMRHRHDERAGVRAVAYGSAENEDGNRG
jgi:hypothetical protein